MKLFNSHLFKASNLAKTNPSIKIPKVVLIGSPNLDLKLFAHRIAIDLGVPALSIN